MMLREFSVSSPRPLPVILLADVSGSMDEHGKIDALNKAVSEMLDVFSAEPSTRVEIQVGIITFGGEARVHQPLVPARNVSWIDMQAGGTTPLGAALELTTEMLEDPDTAPAGAYRPTLVLVSDGMPNDEWKRPLERLLESPRASKAFRFAMGIGPDADRDMLLEFLNDPEGRVFAAEDARHIRDFFQEVTMSVVSRSKSATPNRPRAGATFAKPSISTDDDPADLDI